MLGQCGLTQISPLSLTTSHLHNSCEFTCASKHIHEKFCALVNVFSTTKAAQTCKVRACLMSVFFNQANRVCLFLSMFVFLYSLLQSAKPLITSLSPWNKQWVCERRNSTPAFLALSQLIDGNTRNVTALWWCTGAPWCNDIGNVVHIYWTIALSIDGREEPHSKALNPMH